MSGGAEPSGILEHIRHAEAWLRQARGACARGDVRQVVLRLLLAEAEIRRARESGAWMDVPVSCGVRRGRPARVVWAVVAAGLLVVAASALLRPPGPVPSAAQTARMTSASRGPSSLSRSSGRAIRGILVRHACSRNPLTLRRWRSRSSYYDTVVTRLGRFAMCLLCIAACAWMMIRGHRGRVRVVHHQGAHRRSANAAIARPIASSTIA